MTRRFYAALCIAFIAGMLAGLFLLSVTDTGPEPWPVGRTSAPFTPPAATPVPEWWVRG